MPEKNQQDEEEIVGVLTTAVVRSKVDNTGKKVYIVDIKLVSGEPSDVMFKLEANLKKLVGVKIAIKQPKFGDKL